MDQRGDQVLGKSRAPWHVWLVGGLAFLWYVSGTVTIQLAQLGKLPGLRPDEIAYYATKPAGLVLLTAIGTYGSVVGTVLLLLRERAAVPAFSVALASILAADAIELANGSSRAYANTGAAIVTGVVVVIGVGMLVYARAMQRRW
jgi:hypothetical protein